MHTRFQVGLPTSNDLTKQLSHFGAFSWFQILITKIAIAPRFHIVEGKLYSLQLSSDLHGHAMAWGTPAPIMHTVQLKLGGRSAGSSQLANGPARPDSLQPQTSYFRYMLLLTTHFYGISKYWSLHDPFPWTGLNAGPVWVIWCVCFPLRIWAMNDSDNLGF